jgi:hypothetical protein
MTTRRRNSSIDRAIFFNAVVKISRGNLLQGERTFSINSLMPLFPQNRNDESKMMLGFIVRRCAADLGHTPSPDEFARWANGDNLKGSRFCLFGKEISPTAAKVMFTQPGRLVTVSPEGMARISKGNGR